MYAVVMPQRLRRDLGMMIWGCWAGRSIYMFVMDSDGFVVGTAGQVECFGCFAIK